MRYFTPELYARGNSPNQAEARGVEEEWEAALRRYERRWKKIRAAFPQAVRNFDEAQVCLHDAEVLHLARQGERFVIVLQPGAPAQTLVILTFTLTEDPVIATELLPETVRTRRLVWLYEEFDLDRGGQCCFEVLLSNGWVVQLRFRDFQFLVGQKILSAPDVPAGQSADSTVPRSA
jgi:hypothetical protein